MIPQATLDRIIAATDLAAIVQSEGRDLRQRPGYKVGWCPWCQNPRTPALYVYRDHAFCWRCRGYSSVLDWVMRTQGLPFKEAVHYLADRAGISVAGATQTRVQRAAAAEDAEISPWWWKRHIAAVRHCLDRAMADGDFEFAESCGNFLRSITAMPPAGKLRFFTFHSTAAERKEYRIERQEDAGYRDLILSILEAAA